MKIFISHSNSDNKLVEQIIDVLKEYGVDYWVDLEQLEIGTEATKKINEGLKTSTHFLLVWTKNADESPFWVGAEKDAVIERRDKLTMVSFKLDDTNLGVPFASFIWPNVNVHNLTESTEDVLNTLTDDFQVQLKYFRKKVQKHYDNLPKDAERVVISNFRKFDGGKLYVQQSFKNLSTHEKGSQIAEYVLQLVKNNAERIGLEKDIHTQVSSLDNQLDKLGLDSQIIKNLKLVKDPDDYKKINDSILEKSGLSTNIISQTKLLNNKISLANSYRKKLSRIKSGKKQLEKYASDEQRKKDLTLEEERLHDISFLKTATEGDMIIRNNRLEEIKKQVYELEKRIKRNSEFRIMIENQILSEEREERELNAVLDEIGALEQEKSSFGTDILLKLQEIEKTHKKIMVARRIVEKVQESVNRLDLLSKEKLIPIIGEYGSGKSALCHHVLYRVCRDNFKDYIPIFVPLGQLPKREDSVNHLIEDILDFVHKEYRFKISKEMFDQLISNGKIIFILDALDEMSKKLDNVVAQNNLNHVIKLAEKCVTIITSRYTYLTESMEDKLLIEYNGLIQIQDFTKEEIERYLHRYLPTNETRIEEIKLVIDRHRLGDFAQKPLFLDIICRKFDKMKEYFPINESVILKILTDGWIKHDVSSKEELEEPVRRELTDVRQRISEILAFAEYEKSRPIGIEDIKSQVKEELEKDYSDPEIRLNQYYKDAITSTFLVKEEKETYRFIINPVIEYFVARRIVNDIKKERILSFLKHVQTIKSIETLDFIRGIIEIEWAVQPHVIIDQSKDAPNESKSREILQQYENHKKFVIDLIDDIRNKKYREKAVNLVRLLHMTGNLPHHPNLSGLDLSKIPIPNANLRGGILNDVNLTEANLRGSNLNNAKLVKAIMPRIKLSGADLSNADLSYVDLSGADLSNSDLREADLTGSNLQGANLSNADMGKIKISKTNFSSANLSNTKLIGVDFRDTVVVNANFIGADLQDVQFGKDLRGIKLRGANLEKWNLSETNLNQADLGETVMKNTDLHNSVMRNTDLRWSDLTHADLFRTELDGAKFYGANVQGVNVEDTILVGADLRGVRNLSMPIEDVKKRGGII